MSPLEKLDAIRRMVSVHDIQFRDEGVGLLIYVPGRIVPEHALADEQAAAPIGVVLDTWKKNLVVHRFYPTLEAAIDGEYERLLATPDAGWQLIHTQGDRDY